ncbi:DinB family protein [Mesorhizobium sp. CAU 1741]|uniref:DinB family protein n=1 Tax=Mesorhizobium sp. CAU 1741 TaxID=3140366 RepID=UPI00325A50C7
MIEPAYVELLARYNAEMNRRFIAAAAELDEPRLREDRGVFWKSFLGTMNHILWADLVWLWRFGAGDQPSGTRDASDTFTVGFGEFRQRRTDADDAISRWAGTVDRQWLAMPYAWFAGTEKSFETPRAFQVVHMFNHQTHHRGQAHGVLTSLGKDTGQTDIWIMADDADRARAR